MLIGENERLFLWLRWQGEGLTKPLKAQLIKQKNWWFEPNQNLKPSALWKTLFKQMKKESYPSSSHTIHTGNT